MGDTTVDPHCPIHGDGSAICTCGDDPDEVARLRAERDTLAAELAHFAGDLASARDFELSVDRGWTAAIYSQELARVEAIRDRFTSRVVLAEHAKEQ